MILYYALGGGLGHIARSFALIEHAPRPIRSRIRILVSSSAAPAAEPGFPCPVDRVPDGAMSHTGRYKNFLVDYFGKHRFRCIVMDTFPFGLLSEMKYVMPRLPRILVARYLRWNAYLDMCGGINDAVWPEGAVIIEEQDSMYSDALRNNCFLAMARWPVSPARPREISPSSGKTACCIVHSGPKDEIDQLTGLARRVMAEKRIPGLPRVLTPDDGIFPAERHLSGFSDIVTGAGYASCASAALLKGKIRYHLHPFHRRFDDQSLRLERLKSGFWMDDKPGSSSEAAGILWDLVGIHA